MQYVGQDWSALQILTCRPWARCFKQSESGVNALVMQKGNWNIPKFGNLTVQAVIKRREGSKAGHSCSTHMPSFGLQGGGMIRSTSVPGRTPLTLVANGIRRTSKLLLPQQLLSSKAEGGPLGIFFAPQRHSSFPQQAWPTPISNLVIPVLTAEISKLLAIFA